MTQHERILAALRQAGARGLCVADVPETLGYTMRNRVSELRRSLSGETIVSERCRVPEHHHKATVSRYWLVTVGQQEIAL